MKKIFIEDSRVDSFMHDLNHRLTLSLKSDASIERLIIMAVGESGLHVAKRLHRLLNQKFPHGKSENTGFVVVQKTSNDVPPTAASFAAAALSASPMSSTPTDCTAAAPACLDAAPAAEAVCLEVGLTSDGELAEIVSTAACAASTNEVVDSEPGVAAPSPQLAQEKFVVLLAGTGETLDFDDFIGVEGENTAYLIVDGVCRSGQTLTSVYNRLRMKSQRVWSYSVAVSADSIFIPTWYGCLYEAHEFVVLNRQDGTHNASLFTKSSRFAEERLASPALVLRPPLPGDPEFETDAPSLQRYQADDRYFDSKTRSKRILVLEWNSKPVGFIAFHVDSDTLWIDYIISCQKNGQPGVGTAMYCHVENYAKLQGCQQINLWAISTKVGWYEKRGFVNTSHQPISFGTANPEKYHQMSHRLVSETGHYHI